MEPLFVVIAAILKSLMRIMRWRMHVVGDEHLPAGGPAILASNHVSYVDPVMIGWVVQRRGRTPRFLTKLELFAHPLLGPVLRRLKQVPVDRGGDASSALRFGEERLRDGDWVVVFPEGTISTSFVPAEPRLGAARLALATGAPLYPVALWGGQRILTKQRARSLRRDIAWSVHVGAPVRLEPGEDAVALTRRLWEAVGALVDRAQREYPQCPAGQEDRWWLPRHLGGSAPTVEESAEQRRIERERRGRGRRPGEDA